MATDASINLRLSRSALDRRNTGRPFSRPGHRWPQPGIAKRESKEFGPTSLLVLSLLTLSSAKQSYPRQPSLSPPFDEHSFPFYC